MNAKIISLAILAITLILACSENKESQKEEKIKTSKLEHISGTYHSSFNNGGISEGSVIIKYAGDEKFEFEITTAHRAGCTGYVAGTATIDQNGIGSWSDEFCDSLIFHFLRDKLTIEEVDCGYHGIRCEFRGEYKR